MTGAYREILTSFLSLTECLILYKCLDINECLENPCAKNADCENTDGNFTCTCRALAGYTGDGFNCSRKLSLVLFRGYVFPEKFIIY